MRVLWVSHTSDLAGAERALLESAMGLAGAGHEVAVVVPSAGPLARRFAEVDVHSHVVPLRFWTHPLSAPSPWLQRVRRLAAHLVSARRIARLCAAWKPDAIVSNTLTIPAGALAGRWAGVRHHWFIHEFGREDHDLGFDCGRAASLRTIRSLSARLLFPSRCVREALFPASGDEAQIVPYAVLVPELARAPREPGPLRAVLAGRMVPGKRQEDAVRAIARLAAEETPMKLTLLGAAEGDYARAVDRLIGELGVRSLVEVLPFTERPHEVMARADVALMCSLNEAFGRVTVEAMKLGLAVVGADSAGTAEIVRDGWNGLLYPPGDHEALAAKLRLLRQQPELLAKLGEEGRRWARSTFSLEAHTSALITAIGEDHQRRGARVA